MDLQPYLDFATQLAGLAGQVTLKHFGRGVAVELKSDASPVTIADRETEQLIRHEIMTRYPEHGLLGEEFGAHQPEAPCQWVIDPIDGTQAFIHGVPLFTVLIALLIEGQPRLGVIHNPMLNETVAAATGLGCRLNGTPCQVSQRTSLAEARVHCTDYADLFKRRTEFTSNLLSSVRFARTWADAYGYLLVASGRAEVCIDPIMHPWDMAALEPILTEAGGRLSTLDGQPVCGPNGLANSALASNGLLHPALLALHPPQ